MDDDTHAQATRKERLGTSYHAPTIPPSTHTPTTTNTNLPPPTLSAPPATPCLATALGLLLDLPLLLLPHHSRLSLLAPTTCLG
jgi:hypothetical protein